MVVDVFRDGVLGAVRRRVTALRKERGISQSQLADRVGVKRASISALEAGKQGISLMVLCRVAAELGCEPATLLPTQSELDSMLRGLEDNQADEAVNGLVDEYLERHG